MSVCQGVRMCILFEGSIGLSADNIVQGACDAMTCYFAALNLFPVLHVRAPCQCAAFKTQCNHVYVHIFLGRI